MEFLLQLFADFIGDPKEENKEAIKIEEKKLEENKSETIPVSKQEVEKSILFGLMQFH